MARLISSSPVAIFIVLAVVAAFTEASSYCKKHCYPEDEGYKFFPEGKNDIVKKFFEDAWKPSCKKKPTVFFIGLSFYNNDVADNTRYIAKNMYIEICGECYKMRCGKGYTGFPGIPTITSRSELERVSYKHCKPPKKC